jgi:hypothetical protein
VLAWLFAKILTDLSGLLFVLQDINADWLKENELVKKKNINRKPLFFINQKLMSY